MSFKITNRPLLQFANSFLKWKWVWIATTAAFAGIGLLYVTVLKRDMWAASQGVIIRDEANGAITRLGRFASQEEMKAAQETVLEMARNTQVLSQALKSLGSSASLFSWGDSSEPSKTDLEDLAKRVTLRAPKGSEFGTTEVVYLEVVQSSRDRALSLNRAICDALEERLKLVRKTRATGVIRELLAAKQSASQNLQAATHSLQAMEAEAGTDLIDLRGLSDFGVTGSATRETLETVSSELRLAENELRQVKTDLEIARVSYSDPEQLLQTPSKLVNANPGLKRLREGLAAAAINTAQLNGIYTDLHPLIVAAKETERRIQEQLRSELGTSVATLTKDFEIIDARVTELKSQKEMLESRIGKVAEIRADYGNLLSEVKARNEQLQDAERELAAAQAAREAAESTSLLTRIDEPVLGDSPIGPGRSTILAGATAAGFMIGFGLIFLLTPLDSGMSYGRRQNDFAGGRGRRASDRKANEATENVANANDATASAESQSDEAPSNETATAGDLTTIEDQLRAQEAIEKGKTPMVASTAAALAHEPDRQEDLAEAEAVIAAALNPRFSENEDAPPVRS